jgi:hypothetical protein
MGIESSPSTSLSTMTMTFATFCLPAILILLHTRLPHVPSLLLLNTTLACHPSTTLASARLSARSITPRAATKLRNPLIPLRLGSHPAATTSLPAAQTVRFLYPGLPEIFHLFDSCMPPKPKPKP